jgi:uncharacterized 2Fe-2S/4Fe-4S cluster protein (DUF4445 family)
MKICVYNTALVCEAEKEETILSALGKAGIPISAPCGGHHLCGKCKVRIVSGSIRGAVPDEDGCVLACQAVPETDLTVALLSEDLSYDGGTYQHIKPDKAAGESRLLRAGVALDIGTTTVSARLVDLDTGKELDTWSGLNAQKVFGADVMSRIGAARAGKTPALFNLINRQTEKILTHFKEKFALPRIELLAVAGNTTMLHLFAGIDPSGMGELPFTPVFLEEREYSGGALFLPVETVRLFPSISAFIGGDIVSGLEDIDVLAMNEPVFFIDIGTNGEMALFRDGKIYCASAAAGPALEGAEISCGTGSVRGAINKVEMAGGELRYTTIGDEKPLGICGCGLIDAMALMLDQGIIDETGAFADEDREDFPIAEGISLIGRDVRQFQLAKSAILSGIKILCKSAGLKPGDLKKVYVAGGLGFYIDQKNAVRTGLLPREFLGRVRVCGNTSLGGAMKALIDPGIFGKCRKIVSVSNVTGLADDPEFMDAFAENMLFES